MESADKRPLCVDLDGTLVLRLSILINAGCGPGPARSRATSKEAIDKGRDVVYTPGYWRYIMWVIRLIPESLFKRLLI